MVPFIKAGLLTLAFVAVIVTMGKLKGGDAESLPSWLRFFDQTDSPYPSHLTWCDTRVIRLSFPEGVHIEQVGDQWQRIGPQPNQSVTLNFIAVEKWFSRFCRLPVLPLEVADSDMRPLMEVTFVKGSRSLFLTDSMSQVFVWKSAVFRSESLLTALRELRALANLEP